MRILNRSVNGITYSNPTLPDYIKRIKHTSGRKTIDGTALNNVITEYICNGLAKYKVGDKTISEPVSVRLRVSGSTQAEAVVKAMIISLASDTAKLVEEKVFTGFEPVTPPSDIVL